MSNKATNEKEAKTAAQADYAAMKRAIEQIRLLVAEWLISLAVDVTPKGHEESIAIYEAGMHVAQRKET